MSFTPDEDRVARVKRATAAFDVRIKNLYEPLAQILARRKTLKVLPHPTSSMTDGKTIWLAVPMALGDDTPHQKELCGLRDPITKTMQCPMCQVIDDVDANCFHETFHITSESFKEVDDYNRSNAIRKIVRMKFEDDTAKLTDLLSRLSSERNAMGIAAKLDLYLPMLTNIVEDVFVNAEGFKARPGTIDPMMASSRKYLTGEWETAEGMTSWAERDFNSRALITVYCLVDFEFAIPGFGDDVKPIAEDPRIIEAMNKATSQPTAFDRLNLAIEILGYLREHGACVDSRSELFEPVKVVILTDKPEGGDDDGESEPFDPEDLDDDTVVIDMRTKPDPGEGEGEEGDDDRSEGAKLTPKPVDGDEDAEDDADPDEGSGDGESVDSDDEADDDSEGLGDTADRDGDGEANTDESLGEAGSGTDRSDEAAESDVKGGESDPFTGSDDDEAATEAARKAEVELAERIAKDLDRAMGHEEGRLTPDRHEDDLGYEDRELLTTWLEQKDFFDEPSFGCTRVGFLEGNGRRSRGGSRGLETAPTAMDINPQLTKLRVAFTKNMAMGVSRNLTSGPRLDTSHLYRAPLDDPRLYARRSIPKKRNWFVVIGCDCSGSTHGGAIDVIRKGAYAMAELLSRLGIPFAVYGHSGSGGSGGYKLTFTHVKNPNEPWDDAARSRCMNLEAQSANLDGHTLEYYRRVADQERATDKLIMYFTDGAMPCENRYEEERILRKNIAICQRKNIKLVGVAVRNTDPRKYGLDTIRYDHLSDLPKLIDELGKRLG